ncbi:MAG: YfhO family protein [Butyrivibrio sp.]|nr:YfhO family protein [Butyrivibrio sp.]
MSEGSHNFQKLNISHAVLAGVLASITYIVILIAGKIAPFGDNTFLMFDMKRQYIDYYAYFRTIISGENNIFYSFSTTLGSGTLGFFAYYLTSPFLIILSFFKASSLPIGITTVIGIKLVVAAIIMDLFLQRFVTRVTSTLAFGISNFTVLIGALSWAFCGYLFGHSMNMMWIDVVMLLPLHIWCLERFIVKDKKISYILVLLAMLLLNYYISYQVILFSVFWTVIRVVTLKCQKPFTTILKVAGATIVSVLMSGTILFPTFLELMNSPKDITKLGLELKGTNLSIIDVFSKIPTLSYDYYEPRFGYPQLYCGVLLTIFTLLYFLNKKISLREKISMAIMMVIMIASISFDILNLIWHAGMEPSGHPYRQAFLLVFLMIICGSRAFLDIKEFKVTHICVTWVLAAVFLLLFKMGDYEHFTGLTLVINMFLISLYAVTVILYILGEKREFRTVKFLIPVLFLVNIMDISTNAAYTYHFQSYKAAGESYYYQKHADTQAAVNYVKEYDDSFYRMEDLNPRQQNDGLQFNYNGITHYSSAGMIYVRYFLQRLGFNDDTLYVHYGRDNTETADSILGLKYILGDDTVSVHGDYNEIFDGNKDAYENPYALSVAIGTNDFDLSNISSEAPDSRMNHVPDMDPFSLQEDIYGRLLGKEVSFFDSANIESSGMYEKEGKYCIDYLVTATEDGELYMYFDGLINAAANLSVYVNDEFLTTYGNAACTKILNHGYMKKGDSFKVTMVSEDKREDLGEGIFVTENTGELEKAYKEIQNKQCKVTKKSSSHLIINTGDYDGVFLSVPYERGWNIKVDGKEVKQVAIYDSLIYVPISNEGESHQIEMIFTPDGIYVGIAMTVIGFILLIGLFIMEKGILNEQREIKMA